MKHDRKSLKETIRILEIRQEEQKVVLNKQLRHTFESLKPINLLKSTFREFTSDLEHKSNNVMETILPMVTNLLTAKMLSKKKKGGFFRIFATFVQMGVTNLTAKHSHTIMQVLTEFWERLTTRAKDVTDEEEEETPSEDEEPILIADDTAKEPGTNQTTTQGS